MPLQYCRVRHREGGHAAPLPPARDLLRSQGDATLLGSRDTLREAFRLGLIEQGESLMLMIQDRNLTSHTYNRATADVITAHIVESYPC